MQTKKVAAFDIETDGIDATKIHNEGAMIRPMTPEVCLNEEEHETS